MNKAAMSDFRFIRRSHDAFLPLFLASGTDQNVAKRFQFFKATPGAKRHTAQRLFGN
jgi:hypothetical protein